jgi:hypothetical protein
MKRSHNKSLKYILGSSLCSSYFGTETGVITGAGGVSLKQTKAEPGHAQGF